jgi:hypothetical protein
VGRYFYRRIHRGLYGGRLEARDLIAEAQGARYELGDDLTAAAWNAQFADIEREAAYHPPGFFSAMRHAARLGALSKRSERRFRQDFESELNALAGSERLPAGERRRRLAAGRDRIRRYSAAIRRVGGLGVYERLFAAWHVLHFPLFLMLIITALVHVAAVHLY